MKWKFIEIDGVVDNERQIDELGNIYQKTGGVNPVACQKCKKKFNAKPEQEKIEEDMPLYKCKNCKFEGNTGDQAFDHTLEKKNHLIKKTTTKRLVGYNTILKGIKPRITITEEEVVIVCDKCLQ